MKQRAVGALDAMLGLARACLHRLPLPDGVRSQVRKAARSLLGPLLFARPRRRPLASPVSAVRVHSGGRAIGWRAGHEPDVPACRATVVAFYLPQFHPVPENDEWWGKGFTEWTNVTRALPQFEGHVQPHLPGELGFYDLRLPSIMQRQVELARQYGIGAFCFYYYWFAGRRVLHGPVDHYLRDGSLTLPFCLCWANEPWTRRWDGREEEVLLGQAHGPEDDIDFIASIADYLSDPRYLRIDGRPVLILYRAELLPEPRSTAERWRTYCREAGIGEIHLACVESFGQRDPAAFGFDSAIEFPPNLTTATSAITAVSLHNPDYEGEILDWRVMAAQFRTRKRPHYHLFRGVNPAWDNEARRPGRGRSFVHASPRRYEDWLRAAIDEALAQPGSSDGQLVFVNAWNEWAEGAHLEPDARLGHAWLEATRRANVIAKPAPQHACVVVHAHYPEVLDGILARLADAGIPLRVVVTTSPDRTNDVQRRLAHAGVAAELRIYPNRGRDILPFLHAADELIDDGEWLVLKVHTKRSPHLKDGDAWRDELLDSLLSPANVRAISESFQLLPKLGLVGPDGHLLHAGAHAGANEDRVTWLAGRLGIDLMPARSAFFAGSMFWARLDALRPLLDAHLEPTEFEAESGQRDGTLAHAIERVIPAAVHAAGYHMANSSEPLVEIRGAGRRTYRFVPGGS